MATQQLDIEIIAVGNPAFTKTARGGYSSMEIAFKNHSFEGKVEGKKLVDFNDKAVFEFFKGLKQGDRVLVTKEKGETDQYWKWVGAALSTGSPAGAPAETGGSVGQPPQGDAGARPTGRVVGNNYAEKNEIDRERLAFDQVKHRQIGRQGCLNTAVNILSGQSPAGINVNQVIAVSAQLEEYVFGTKNHFSDMKDDIPV